MADSSPSFQEVLRNPGGFSAAELQRARAEWLLGTSATLLHQRGHADIAALLAQVTSSNLVFDETDWGKDWFDLVCDVDQSLVERFTEEVTERVTEAIREVTEQEEYGVARMRVRAILPTISPDWRQQLQSGGRPRPSNHARKVRLDPAHHVADGLYFTNEWELRVYSVLKEQQAQLPDNETLGIMPLGAMKVRDHVFEPDLLVTYRGCAGVIEIDGPHHKGRSSDDKSRERLLRHAGVKYIDRIDVRDVTTKAEVEKFITDFLRLLVG
jgi:hypothetical protein